MDLLRLRLAIEQAIADHAGHARSASSDSIATQKTADAQAKEWLDALVDPRWCKVLVRESACQITGSEASELRDCVLVADDRRGHEIYADPARQCFYLAYAGSPPATVAVRDNVVACFMARQ
jgi:hypothetical protein